MNALRVYKRKYLVFHYSGESFNSTKRSVDVLLCNKEFVNLVFEFVLFATTSLVTNTVFWTNKFNFQTRKISEKNFPSKRKYGAAVLRSKQFSITYV